MVKPNSLVPKVKNDPTRKSNAHLDNYMVDITTPGENQLV
jgi:hypothetical protein